MAIEHEQFEPHQITLLTTVPDAIVLPAYQSNFLTYLREDETVIYENDAVIVSRVNASEQTDLYSVYDTRTCMLNYLAGYESQEDGINMTGAQILTYSIIPDIKSSKESTLSPIVPVEVHSTIRDGTDSFIQMTRLCLLPINRQAELDEQHGRHYADFRSGLFPLVRANERTMNREGLSTLASVHAQLIRVPGNGHLRNAHLPTLGI